MSNATKWMGCVSGAAAMVLMLGAGEGLAQQDTTQWGQDTAQAPIGQQDTAQVENEVTITVRDGQIEMEEELQSGQTLFTVVNEGSEEHSLVIEGQGVGEPRMEPGQEEQPPEEEQQEEQEFRMEEGEFMESLARNLSAGETETLTANLTEGEYVAWCPVEGHRDQGEEITFNVKQKEGEYEQDVPQKR